MSRTLLADLAAARDVWHDSREDAAPLARRHAAFRLVWEVLAALRPDFSWRRSLSDQVQVRVNEDPRLTRRRAKREHERDLLANGVVPRTREWDWRIAKFLDDWDVRLEFEQTIQDSAFRAVMSSNKTPFSEEGFAMVRASIISALRDREYSSIQVNFDRDRRPRERGFAVAAVAPGHIHEMKVSGVISA